LAIRGLTRPNKQQKGQPKKHLESRQNLRRTLAARVRGRRFRAEILGRSIVLGVLNVKRDAALRGRSENFLRGEWRREYPKATISRRRGDKNVEVPGYCEFEI
jgi:hypothetical protein